MFEVEMEVLGEDLDERDKVLNGQMTYGESKDIAKESHDKAFGHCKKTPTRFCSVGNPNCDRQNL